MRPRMLVIVTLAAVCIFGRSQFAQSPASPVDFVRDVQPIFEQRCYQCHGSTQQMNGLRLDRRRDAMRGGTLPVIGPGNSVGSRLYLRLTGDRFGRQMPPTGPLPASEVDTIRRWIDQGATWPDSAAADPVVTIPNPAAARAVAALRDGDSSAFDAAIAADPAALTAKGPGGSTTLMYAALYADVGVVRGLLAKGADPNAKNDAGATALMWAAADLDKVRALVEAGADVNARSDDARTPLLVAAELPRNTAVVKLLLDRGAKVNVTSSWIGGAMTPLTAAAFAGNDEAFRLILDAGGDLKLAGPAAAGLALRSGCMSCAEALLKAFDPPLLTGAMIGGGPPTGPALGYPMLLERGAKADARDPEGRSLLMLAAASEAMPVDAIGPLVAHGVDVNAKTPAGETALVLARRHGATPMVDALIKAGAVPDGDPQPPLRPSPAASARAAVLRSLPLLQRTDESFLKASGCVSCHNNSLTAMTIAAARARGLAVDDESARRSADRIGRYLVEWRERVLQGKAIPGDVDTASYILAGLAALNYPADEATDAQARLIKLRQMPDGQWLIFANRPPIESSNIQVTAMSIRALQAYAPRQDRASYDAAISAGRSWLMTAKPRTTEDSAFRLLGLSWARADDAAIREAARALAGAQRADGGWAQIPSMASDAYATGQAMVALIQSGAFQPADPACARAASFLLKTQLSDGSWFVGTRALPIQPIFDAGFPHGRDAFISAAATNWAATALAMTMKKTS